MTTILTFLAVLATTLTSIILYGKSSEKNGRKGAIIDIRRAQNRRETIAKFIESESIETDSNSVANAWRKLS